MLFRLDDIVGETCTDGSDGVAVASLVSRVWDAARVRIDVSSITYTTSAFMDGLILNLYHADHECFMRDVTFCFDGRLPVNPQVFSMILSSMGRAMAGAELTAYSVVPRAKQMKEGTDGNLEQ